MKQRKKHVTTNERGLFGVFNYTTNQNYDTWENIDVSEPNLGSGINIRSPSVPVLGFRELIKRGENATSPLEGSRYFSSLDEDNVAFGTICPFGSIAPYRRAWRLWGPDSSVNPKIEHSLVGSFSSADNLALTRFYKSVRETRTRISGPTFAGELRESISMIRKPMNGIFRVTDRYLTYLQKYRKGIPDKTRWIDFLGRNLSDMWLEVQLGWKPLINDAKAIAESIASLIENDRHKVCRGYGLEIVKEPLSSVIKMSNIDLQVVTQSHADVQYETIFRGALNASLDFPDQFSVDRIRTLFGFTWENFVPTAWELLPYSFLADYVGNFGNVLECNSTDTSAIAWVSRTRRKTTTWHRASDVKFLREVEGPTQTKLARVRQRVVSVSRHPLIGGLPDVKVQLRIPNAGQLSNVYALLIGKAKHLQPL